MTTNTLQVAPPVRQDPRQVVNTLKKTINWNDAGLTNAGVINNIAFDNSLPQNAVILAVLCEIVITFDGGAILTLGTVAAAYNNIINAGDVDETVAGVYVVTRGLGQSLTSAADIAPVATLTENGATKGQAVITVTYEGGWQS